MGMAALFWELVSEYKSIFISLAWRLVPMGAIGAVGWWLLDVKEGGFEQVGRLLMGMACFLVAAIIIAPVIAKLIAEPAGSIYYPEEPSDYKPPVYGIPESKRAKGLYEEAIADFEKIAEEYPDEVTPHVRLIDIAIRNLKDPVRAKFFYQRGMEALKKEEDKLVLARMYAAIRTRLNAKPSN